MKNLLAAQNLVAQLHIVGHLVPHMKMAKVGEYLERKLHMPAYLAQQPASHMRNLQCKTVEVGPQTHVVPVDHIYAEAARYPRQLYGARSPL